jgi:hypothetical protein
VKYLGDEFRNSHARYKSIWNFDDLDFWYDFSALSSVLWFVFVISLFWLFPSKKSLKKTGKQALTMQNELIWRDSRSK